MEMKRCENGHFYDASLSLYCPYCNGNTGRTGANNDGKTVALNAGTMMGGMSSSPAQIVQPMMSMPQMQSFPVGGDGKTVALFQTESGVDPCVGWLVCISGVNKGRDYRLHSENNYIGRDDRMDVCIKGDEHVSRENQAIVTYDETESSFYLSSGMGRSIVRLNGTSITNQVVLKSGDKISFGETELMFVAFCGDLHKWDYSEEQ